MRRIAACGRHLQYGVTKSGHIAQAGVAITSLSLHMLVVVLPLHCRAVTPPYPLIRQLPQQANAVMGYGFAGVTAWRDKRTPRAHSVHCRSVAFHLLLRDSNLPLEKGHRNAAISRRDSEHGQTTERFKAGLTIQLGVPCDLNQLDRVLSDRPERRSPFFCLSIFALRGIFYAQELI